MTGVTASIEVTIISWINGGAMEIQNVEEFGTPPLAQLSMGRGGYLF